MEVINPWDLEPRYVLQGLNIYFESLVRKFSKYVFDLPEPSSGISSSSDSSNLSSSSASGFSRREGDANALGNAANWSPYPCDFMRVNPALVYFSYPATTDPVPGIMARLSMIFLLLAVLVQISFFASRSVAEKQSGLTSMMEIVNTLTQHVFVVL